MYSVVSTSYDLADSCLFTVPCLHSLVLLNGCILTCWSACSCRLSLAVLLSYILCLDLLAANLLQSLISFGCNNGLAVGKSVLSSYSLICCTGLLIIPSVGVLR